MLKITPLSRLFFGSVALLLSLLPSLLLAQASMGLGYSPKYAAGFDHFDYSNPNAPQGGELVLAGFGTFETLNPYLLKGLSAEGLNGLVFETLLEKSLDEPFSMYGLLAEDIELAADGLSVQFRLNAKARFSNGDPVTAEDVKFSFDTLRSDQAHPQFRLYWGDIKQAVVLDKRNIRFDFARKNPELHLILGELPVFSRAWVGDKAFDKVVQVKPIGSGPYRVVKLETGKYIRYEKNPDYWGKNLNSRRGFYNFDSVMFKYYKDMTVALEAFKAGEFDFQLENHSKRWARDYDGSKFKQGLIKKETVSHSNNAGMQGFVFNSRREVFQDRRVRRALTLAFDFDWSNKNLFYGQYVRCDSYFSNTELAADAGKPQGAELALLNEFRDQLPAAVFAEKSQPPVSSNRRQLRNNLRQAKKLLTAAGWKIKQGQLVNENGKVFEFEFLLAQKGFERILAPFARNLKKLGIQMNYRTVDTSLYQRRADTFDFDMMVVSYGQSQSPGNELKAMFHSSSADQKGSRNYMGLKDPVVDALLDNIIYAKNRAELKVAAQALDRVLMQGEYLLPNWYIDTHRIAYWNKFAYPKTLPLYFSATDWMLKTWWSTEKP
ncbi:MAG: extracellular solute-binding protein [Gammaproteobacteria bacterium]|nr:extracellular solute-binding protein [Gammaproteobacteria bacterium]